jgi:uncharacterized protein (DUF2267 family)
VSPRAEQPVDAERIARAVFRVLEGHVASGEIEDIRRILPADMDELWQESHETSVQNRDTQT